MSVEQIVTGGLILVLLAAVIGQGISVYRKDSQNADLIKIVSATARDIANNPVWIETARAAAQSVPQASFNALIDRMDTFEAFVGQDSPIGRAAQGIEDVIRRIDKDPANDPKDPDATPIPGAALSGSMSPPFDLKA